MLKFQSGLDPLKICCEENKLTVKSRASQRKKKAQRVQLYYDIESLECVDSFKFNNLNNAGRAVKQLCRKKQKNKNSNRSTQP